MSSSRLVASRATLSDKRNVPMPAKKMLLSSRTTVDRLSANLHSTQGAQEVIEMIKDRPNVTRLILSHNSLGDDGCEVLFNFLCSEIGRKRRIIEVKLAKNGLGDRALFAIAEYLRDNHTLQELYIPANEFTPNPSVIDIFVSALNTSHLAKLNIGSHPSLSDTFIEHFLPALKSTYLAELHLTMLGLTYASVPYIIAYITDPSRCKYLRALLLNANHLEAKGVAELVDAIATGNWNLADLEIYSNASDQAAYTEQAKVLKQLLTRNQIMKRRVEGEALGFLRPARALLLPPHDPSPSPSSAMTPKIQIPTELYLYILSFLAPTLSPAQRLCVFSYASSYETLPALLPQLFSLGPRCLPDPTNSPPILNIVGGTGSGYDVGCMAGCIKGMICQREVQRTKWLRAVGCDVYEPIQVP